METISDEAKVNKKVPDDKMSSVAVVKVPSFKNNDVSSGDITAPEQVAPDAQTIEAMTSRLSALAKAVIVPSSVA
jgi:hypothetical protein